MYFKKMIGKKCYLSPIDQGDAEKFAEWLNDLEVTVHLSFYPGIINTESEKGFLETLSREHNYSIINNETNTLIGNCGYINLDHVNQTAEAGIFIGNKNYWNRGYGTEALTLLADYGFKALNLHNIGLRVYAFNERAIACYQRVGFKPAGRRREALLRGQTRSDIVYMDLLADEFYAAKQQTGG
jgi:RimJ/RimL family protein N-acetyltransferase